MAIPARKPPRVIMPGPIEWLRENLFSSWGNAALTLVAVFVVWWTVVPFLEWAFINAAWTGGDREACLPHPDGACWPFIIERSGQILYGFYDTAERWRIACGTMTRRSICPRLRPKACDASICPFATPSIPARTASAI